MKGARPLVGVSQCLLGDAVRYDGQSKTNHIVLEKFEAMFELIPVCPEVEAGLSIPRPAVQLSGSIQNPKLIGRDDSSVDITDIMQTYCQTKPAELKNLSGFIFKSRSPSCGLNSTPVFVGSQCVTETSRGVFARALHKHYPELPLIEDDKLDESSISHFVAAVQAFDGTRFSR